MGTLAAIRQLLKLHIGDGVESGEQMREFCKLLVSVALLGVAVLAVVPSAGAKVVGAGSTQILQSSVTRVLPNVNFAMPPASHGCRGAVTLAGGATRLPITVSVVRGQVEELANVCIDSKGPFPFEIDTGAGTSVVSSSLASQLGLPASGSAIQSYGAGCTLSVQPVSVDSWSLAGVNLAPQTLDSATLPDFGTPGQPLGLLGSDVLVRFGAVRIDFAHGMMILATQEGAVPSGNVSAHGLTGPPPTRVITLGQRGRVVPATTVLTPGDVGMSVKVRFSHGPARNFSVDTGTTQSIVSHSTANVQHLTSAKLLQSTTTSCATVTVPLVHSGPWSVPGTTLYSQLLETIPFQAASTGGFYGVLGSDQLYRFGWVILDYSGGRLILG